MPSTTNKGFEIQTTGSNAGTWGTVLNDNMIQYVDDNLSLVTTLTLSNVNVTLSAAQSRSCMLRLTGTMTGNVIITSACVGFYMVENVTSGAFTVTCTNGVSGVTVTQSRRMLLYADVTNGTRIMSNASLTGTDPTPIPAGTVMLFLQNAAPTGWTISSSFNDKTIKVVNSGGGTTGGTVAFSTVFARTATDGFTLTTAEMPTHDHSFAATTGGVSANHTHTVTTGGVSANHTHTVTTGTESVSHTHSGTTAGQSNTHDHSVWNQSGTTTVAPAGATIVALQTGGTTSGANNQDHTHAFTSGTESVGHTHSGTTAIESADHTHSGTTAGQSVDHTHSLSGTTGSAGGGGVHAHNIDLRVTFVTAIAATKDA